MAEVYVTRYIKTRSRSKLLVDSPAGTPAASDGIDEGGGRKGRWGGVDENKRVSKVGRDKERKSRRRRVPMKRKRDTQEGVMWVMTFPTVESFTVRPGGFGEGWDGVSFFRRIKKKKVTTEGRVEERGRAGEERSWRMREGERKEKERDSYPTKEGNFCCARAISGRYHSGTGDFVQWQEG